MTLCLWAHCRLPSFFHANFLQWHAGVLAIQSHLYHSGGACGWATCQLRGGQCPILGKVGSQCIRSDPFLMCCISHNPIKAHESLQRWSDYHFEDPSYSHLSPSYSTPSHYPISPPVVSLAPALFLEICFLNGSFSSSVGGDLQSKSRLCNKPALQKIP